MLILFLYFSVADLAEDQQLEEPAIPILAGNLTMTPPQDDTVRERVKWAFKHLPYPYKTYLDNLTWTDCTIHLFQHTPKNIDEKECPICGEFRGTASQVFDHIPICKGTWDTFLTYICLHINFRVHFLRTKQLKNNVIILFQRIHSTWTIMRSSASSAHPSSLIHMSFGFILT